mmetsp:Transcript_14986/g.35280  ORF Transcript_14986/g.35280 Transcript_14986/m.35280 type:complete len:84 (+) Transcript_14986:52-303(+)
MSARSGGFLTRANDASEGPAAADSSTLVNDLKDALKKCVAQVRGEGRFWEVTGGYIKELVSPTSKPSTRPIKVPYTPLFGLKL